MVGNRIHGSMTVGTIALALTACAANPPPVPVYGDAEDRADLTGEWTGEYWSAESGRSGSILFLLTEGADSATGDVLMIPASQAEHHQHAGGQHPASEFIAIRFVRVQAGRVRGQLEIYRDPVCGCRLDTTFEGVLRDGTMSGTFTSRHIEGGDVQHGHWRASRRDVSAWPAG
jgi:hypothetical protein